jgi:hypothetical protein
VRDPNLAGKQTRFLRADLIILGSEELRRREGG